MQHTLSVLALLISSDIHLFDRLLMQLVGVVLKLSEFADFICKLIMCTLS